jgi:hypothetical protein
VDSSRKDEKKKEDKAKEAFDAGGWLPHTVEWCATVESPKRRKRRREAKVDFEGGGGGCHIRSSGVPQFGLVDKARILQRLLIALDGIVIFTRLVREKV